MPPPSPGHSQERCSDALRPMRLRNMPGRRLRGCVRGVHPRQGDRDSTSFGWDMHPSDSRLPYARGTHLCGENWLSNRCLSTGRPIADSWEGKALLPRFNHQVSNGSLLHRRNKGVGDPHVWRLPGAASLERQLGASYDRRVVLPAHFRWLEAPSLLSRLRTLLPSSDFGTGDLGWE